MANLRVNNVVGFGSTDAGVNFTGAHQTEYTRIHVFSHWCYNR